MEEYRRLRSEFSFIDLCRRPELAAKITLLPVDRLGVDAAIIFSDILLLLEPMGVGLEYGRGDGPLIRRPVRSGSEVGGLAEVEPEKSLGFVFEAIQRSCGSLGGRVPLIGFSGAPFTLASYLIEGGSSRNYIHTKRLMYYEAEAWRALMERLVRAIARYLNAQIAAGAQAVQIFDSWAGCLSPQDYQQYVLPYSCATIEALTRGVPVIHFSTGTAGLLRHIRAAGGDIIGVDWRVNLDEAWESVGYDVGIQGNLDPVALLAPVDEIRRKVAEILSRAGGRPGHIFNLGHGVLPDTPVEHVIAMVQAVHELSAR